MKVKEYREKENLSQREFAQKYDISLRTLQEWEQGRSNPPGSVLKLLEMLNRSKEKRGLPLKEFKRERKTTWKICISRPFLNCEKVYPIQQRKVKQILDELQRDPDVKEVILFGSSVTPFCHVGSDVDLYVKMNRDKKPLKGDFGFAVDLWTDFTADDRLKKEIEKKGVKVYGREKNAL